MKSILKLIKNIRHLFRTLYAEYQKRMVALAFFGLFAGFLEGVGITLLVPLFMFFLDSKDASNAASIEVLSKVFNFLHIGVSFQTILIVTASVFIFKSVVLFWFGYIRAKIVADYKVVMRSRIYRDFLSTSYLFLRKEKMGHLDHVLMRDVKQSSRVLENAIGILLSVSNLIIYLTIAFALSPTITLITLGFGVFFLILYRPILKKIRIHSKTLIAVGKILSHAFSEVILGVKTIKAYAVEKNALDSATPLFKKVEQAEFKKQIMRQFAKISIEPASAFLILSVFAISYFYLEFNIAAFISIMYLIHQMFGHVEKIQTSLHLVSEMVPSAIEVKSLMDKIQMNKEEAFGSTPFSFKERISFKNVTFGYDGENVLENISFDIKKGEMIGIAGPSGAGKTTLADLLLRLFRADKGEILIDGKNIDSFEGQSLRKRIVYVAQDIFLRNTTLLENVRFYDDSISQKRIKDALEKSKATEIVEKLPQKLDTVIGERGTRLSGGERQRIALARALSREPDVLILDEATSALDAESEKAIKSALLSLKRNVTVIMIAHRLSTLFDCDKILVIDKGKIVEEGSPERLLKDKESYIGRMHAIGKEV